MNHFVPRARPSFFFDFPVSGDEVAGPSDVVCDDCTHLKSRCGILTTKPFQLQSVAESSLRTNRIFLSAGAEFAHFHRGLPYTERNSPTNSNTMLEKKQTKIFSFLLPLPVMYYRVGKVKSVTLTESKF